MKKIKILALVLALVMCLGTVSAYAASSPDNDLVIAIPGPISTLDPHNMTETHAMTAASGIYESLVNVDLENGFVGVLAESWDISEDGLTYTFKLREGVTFHDGTPFNADAVVANFDRILDPDSGLTRTNNWYITEEDGTRTPRVEVTADDEYTVTFQLTQGWSSFLNRLALIPYASPDAIDEYGLDIMYHACGTGPFVLKEWNPGVSTVMTPNPNYWGEAPTVDSVTIMEVPEAGTRTAMLQTGEADFVYPMTSDQEGSIAGDENITLSSVPSNIMRYVTLNMDLEPLSDLRVRQAMNYAVDKNAYIAVMYNGDATIADSVFPPTISYYAPQTVYEYDLEKAKSLMEEAGYADGFDLTIWCDNETQEIKGSTFIQQQLSQIGINVEVVPYDAGSMDADRNVERDEATINMWYVNWSASSFSADDTVRALLHSSMMPPVSANTAYYENPEFDSTLDEAQAIADPDQLTELYAKVQEIAWNDCPWIFLAVDNVRSACRSYLTGVTVGPDGRISFNNAVLAK